MSFDITYLEFYSHRHTNRITNLIREGNMINIGDISNFKNDVLRRLRIYMLFTLATFTTSKILQISIAAIPPNPINMIPTPDLRESPEYSEFL